MTTQPTTSRIPSLRRHLLAIGCALAAATCTSDDGGPSHSGRAYLAVAPRYELANGATPADFGIVADSIRILLTRPVDVVVLDTTVDFPADSSALHLSLPVSLEQSPETLDAVIEIRSGGSVIFVDSLQAELVDGPPGSSPAVPVVLDYVGPGTNVATLQIAPADTTVTLGDTLFFTATAKDGANAPVANFYVGWKTSDTLVARINAQGRFIASGARGTIQVIGFTPTGIADTTTVVMAPVPVVITADSGQAQSGLVGDSLAGLFVGRVKGADSLGISGIGVRFAAVTAGGTVRDTITLFTDANGRVKTRGKLGLTPGSYSYTATIVGTPIARTFTATANPGAASSIAIQSGNNQTDSAGRALPAPFVVRVADAFNNPVPGAKVYWLRTAGSGAVAPDSSFTDGAGLTQATYTLGAVGVDSVRATLAATSGFVTFRATAINGAPASLTIFFGNAQTDTVGQALTDSLIVTMLSATGQPVVGANVSWTVLRGGSTSPAPNSTTGVNGRAAVRYTTGTLPGTDSVRAQFGGLTATFTHTVLVGAPSAMALVSGDAQTDTAGRTLANPLVVHVVDAFGNDVSGAQVAWNVLRGGSPSQDTTVTGVNGQASVTYTLGLTPGIDSVRAQLVGTGATIDFTATVEVLTASQLFLISGDAQSDTVTRVLVPMVVEAQASDARVVDSTTIQWVIASGSGSLSAPTTLTDSLGRTANTLTLPVAPGSTTVLAILPGHDTVTFTATATPDAPTSFTINAGAAQTDTVDATLAPFYVQVTDSFGNPRSGLAVIWTRTTGTGTPTLDTVVTDAGGLSSFTYTLGTVAQDDSIRATLQATGATLDFGVTVLTGLADSMSILSGDGQTGIVGQGLAINPSVEVFDRHSNPISALPVAFVVTAGGGTPSLDTSFTSVAGISATGFTLGTGAGTQTLEARARNGAVVAVFTFTASPDAPDVIAITGGNGQSDTANAVLATPLTVHVSDQYANPVPGTPVAFTVIAGGGSMLSDTVIADSLGNAASFLKLGATPGADSVVAQVATAGGPSVIFGATTLAAAPAFLAYVAGDGQTDTVARTLATPLRVKVIDLGANPVPGVTVVFSIVSGSGSPSLSADTVLTDSLGEAATSLTLGTLVGTTVVQAVTTTPADTVPFTVTGVNDLPAAIAVTSGTGQSVEVLQLAGASVDVEVTDAFGNTVNGAAVAWSTGGPGSSVAPDTSFTSGTGDAAASFTAGPTIGQDSVTATLVGTSASISVLFDVFAAPPVAVALVSGDSQSAVIGTPFSAPLTVLVTDSLGNPVAGAQVTWQDSAGAGLGSFAPDTSVTDGTGHASTTYTPAVLAGPRTLQAFLVAAPATVTFHGTALAGAAASIVGDSGDAQSDSVFTTLAIPLRVLVRDAASNPVDTAPITWVVVSGNATLNDSSTVTDASGHSTVNVTFGGVSGPVAIRAILGASVDSAVFHLTSLPGVPATFLKVSGDDQTAIVSTPVALPLVAQVQDAWGNGVPGENVSMAISAGGGSLDSVETVTDSLGYARAVTWTLGSGVGTNGVQMNWTSFFQNFTATSLPIGTSKSWAGTTSTDWSDPTNWAPTGVPLGSEGVYIPASTPFTAGLTAPSAVAALTVQAGASVQTNGFTLTASGDIRAANGIFGTGILEAAGSGTTIEGVAPNLLVTGTVKLSNNVSLTGNATVDGGQIDIDSLALLALSGSFQTQNGGTVKMTHSAGFLTIGNGVTFTGGSETGLLTQGTIYMSGGNFAVGGPSSTAFDANATLNLQLDGAALQTISIADPANSQLGQLVLTGLGGTQFLTDAVTRAQIIANGGPVTGVGRTVTVGGTGIFNGADKWTVTNTIFTGNPTITDSLRTNATFLTTAGPGSDFRLVGDLTIRGAGTQFILGGNTFTVTGALTVDSNAVLNMTVPGDSLLVAGNVTIAGGSTSGLLTEGVLRIGGHFVQGGDPQAFAPTGAHRTVFAPPATADSISFANPGATASRFHHVEFEGGGASYHYFTGNAVVTGQMVVGSGAQAYNFNTGSAGKLTFTSKLPIGAGYWNVDMAEVAGNVVLDSATTVAGRLLRITGATSTLDVNGQSLAVNDLDVRNSGLLRMVTPGGIVTVSGNASFGGRSTLSQLTAGEVHLYGDFAQLALTNTRSYMASGTHKTVFNGGDQLATFGSPGATSSRFNDLEVDNVGSVTFGSLAVVSGNASALNGTVAGVVGVSIAGSLSDPYRLWHPATTTFTGAGPVLPDTMFGNIIFTNNVGLGAPTHINGSLTISGPSAQLSLGGLTLTISDTLTTELGGMLHMNVPTDSIEVGMLAFFSGASDLTAGTLVLHGNLEQVGGPAAFNAQPGHLTVLAPSVADTVTFSDPDSVATGSGFGDLRIVGAGNRVVLGSEIEVRGLFNVTASAGADPVIEGNGNGLTVRGIDIDGVTFERAPLRIHQTDTLQTLTVLNSAFTSFLSSDTQLYVANPGTGAFQGNFNSLTFTPLTAGDTGFYVVVNNSDIVGPNFVIGIVGTNVANGPSFSGSVNSGGVNWF